MLRYLFQLSASLAQLTCAEEILYKQLCHWLCGPQTTSQLITPPSTVQESWREFVDPSGPFAHRPLRQHRAVTQLVKRLLALTANRDFTDQLLDVTWPSGRRVGDLINEEALALLTLHKTNEVTESCM